MEGKNYYRSINKLINSIDKKAKMASKTLAKSAENYLRYKTQQNLYNEMRPGQYYKRTGQFLNSITLKFSQTSNKYSLMFDGRKIKKVRGTGKNFNAHADFHFNKFSHEKYIKAMEEGHFVPIFNPVKGYMRDGAHMIRDTRYWLEIVMLKIKLNLSSGMTITKSVRSAIKI